MTSGPPDTPPRTSLNLCDLPPWAIASRAFNTNPQPLRIQGVRSAHHRLFSRLDELTTGEARAQTYQDYMDVAFHLHQWRDEAHPSDQLSLKNHVLRFLSPMVGLLAELLTIENDFFADPTVQRWGLQMLLGNPERCCVLVAEAVVQVVGMMTVQVLTSTAEGGPVGLLEDLVVEQACLGAGGWAVHCCGAPRCGHENTGSCSCNCWPTGGTRPGLSSTRHGSGEGRGWSVCGVRDRNDAKGPFRARSLTRQLTAGCDWARLRRWDSAAALGKGSAEGCDWEAP